MCCLTGESFSETFAEWSNISAVKKKKVESWKVGRIRDRVGFRFHKLIFVFLAVKFHGMGKKSWKPAPHSGPTSYYIHAPG